MKMDPDTPLPQADQDARHRVLSALNPSKPAPGLYLVATPIGNASDMTLRALAVLAGADTLYCEDTRVTSKLLSIYGIRQKLEPYHEHNGAKVRPKIAAKLGAGEVIAFVSDAGTPSISDPGFRLAKEMREQGYAVTHCPGPSAALTGLVLSGLPTDRFFFAGFLPPKSMARKKALEELATIPATLVFYESPKRLAATLTQMQETLGNRTAAIARELTKKFEEIRQGSLSELAKHYIETGSPKGEVVILIEGFGGKSEVSEDELEGLLLEALRHGSLKDAVAAVVAQTGLPRRHVYDLALRLKRDLAGA